METCALPALSIFTPLLWLQMASPVQDSSAFTWDTLAVFVMWEEVETSHWLEQLETFDDLFRLSCVYINDDRV